MLALEIGENPFLQLEVETATYLCVAVSSRDDHLFSGLSLHKSNLIHTQTHFSTTGR